MHAFNPSTWRQRQADLYKFEASLVYRVSSRTTRDIQRNPVSKKQKNQNIKTEQQQQKDVETESGEKLEGDEGNRGVHKAHCMHAWNCQTDNHYPVQLISSR